LQEEKELAMLITDYLGARTFLAEATKMQKPENGTCFILGQCGQIWSIPIKTSHFICEHLLNPV
jgi:hypothetical protein